jgi:phosphoglycerate dehydrogenase-like enzyme
MLDMLVVGSCINGVGIARDAAGLSVRQELDVLPIEPPVEPVPELLRLYRAREPWLESRLIVTPHAAWLTPESEADTRRKSAETARKMSSRRRCIRAKHPKAAVPNTPSHERR